MDTIECIFLKSAIKRLLYYKALADETFARLDDAQFHYQPNEESNSIAIIIQHVSGNMLSRWTDFLNSDGEKDWRERDGEFEVQQLTKTELVAIWEKGWACCINTLQSLVDEDLLKIITIRQEPLTVLDAINRQLSHYPYHVGQIVYLGKILTNDKWQSLSIARQKPDYF